MERQARSELLDQVAKFCGLERTKFIEMMKTPYHAPVRAPINLAPPWHSSATKVADFYHNIITGKLSKSLKKLNCLKTWGPKDFYLATGYSIHRLER